MVFLMILGITVVAGGVIAYASNAPARAVEAKKKVKAARVETLVAEDRAEIATNALRSIQDGAGNPVLEAQIALDEIRNNQIKEINQ